ncbi:glycosyltransferase family 69 protein [Xylona heveae TC161]|uniref:Glycosyltransferase family 69 protein n=1 Tax=Xylona heveae (strain CBS 132557 / TC161) TaxID=1328760 RepID=A0A164ZLJ4_XYLHT|nr:glycosyltransferase family 69 protein [Xylona heveae TC161]KZF19248.1 glycosyltransferase family 69 protein [Xylona heveae TC161]
MQRQGHSYELLPTSSERAGDSSAGDESGHTILLAKLWHACKDRPAAEVSYYSIVWIALSSVGRKIRRFSFISLFFLALLALIILTPLLNPSYLHRPAHYVGGNPFNEKVFIAANIVDADLIRGAWGQAVIGLIDELGAENTYLSIYENDSGPETREALAELRQKVKCRSTIISEHLPRENIPKVELPSGEKRIKRIEYLATVRNRALQPLDTIGKFTAFDKILFLNDVVFSPVDAANLLFSTNIDSEGRAQYSAACAVDFINPFKFYDTFATRDVNGHSMGVPFFPWFTPGQSRNDVLSGKDAIPVQSCWGGMVAFDAMWFQPPKASWIPAGLDLQQSVDHVPQPPLRFRAEKEMFWESSECCLIHADIQAAAAVRTGTLKGIYVNPFIRVAYDESTQRWLETTRRFEKLYPPIHRLISKIAGLPRLNSRRLESPGQSVNHTVWIPAPHNRFEDVRDTAPPGGFCGIRALQVLKTKRKPGEKMWEVVPMPAQ